MGDIIHLEPSLHVTCCASSENGNHIGVCKHLTEFLSLSDAPFRFHLLSPLDRQGIISQMFLPPSGSLSFCLPFLSFSSPSRSSNSPVYGCQPGANTKTEISVPFPVTRFLQDDCLNTTCQSSSREIWLSSAPFHSVSPCSVIHQVSPGPSTLLSYLLS